jgi:hypothetical protein
VRAKSVAKTSKYEGKTERARFAAAQCAVTATRSDAIVFPWAGVLVILGSSIAAKLSTSYSHPLFSLPASGLRLEMARSSDKLISEVYFLSTPKKFLTLKLNRQVS